MAEVPLQRQFIGQARLVRLLLWRVGDSTDIDECLRVALSSGMIAPDDEAFLHQCLAYEERQREQGASPAAKPSPEPAAEAGRLPEEGDVAAAQRATARTGRSAASADRATADAAPNVGTTAAPLGTFPLDVQTIARLRRCADKLNRADAA